VEDAAIVYHSGVADYDFGPGHPFRGDRFPRFMRLVREHGLLTDHGVRLVEPCPAGDPDLLLAHDEDYIRMVERCGQLSMQLEEDTPLNPSIVRAARLVVGTSLRAGELVAEGSARVAEGVGGGLHHADVAACAASLLERHGMERVMVFDTDVHAGNGTMDIFYEDPRVLFVSVHQDPRTFYPGTGFIEQIGSGPGEGYTVNVPLSKDAGDDCMRLVLEEVFEPLAEEFGPQAIIRNGGSDPHFRDWLGGLRLTYSGLRMIGETVAEAAQASGCGVVDLCCSGYNPETVAEGWLAIISGVMGIDLDLKEPISPPRGSESLLRETQRTIDELKEALRGHWSLG